VLRAKLENQVDLKGLVLTTEKFWSLSLKSLIVKVFSKELIQKLVEPNCPILNQNGTARITNSDFAPLQASEQ
jgi:hypothetical protein